MADSQIEWTDRVWNPTTGCDRISPGCDHCYALTMARRLKAMGQAKYQLDGDPRTSGPGFRLTTHADTLDVPLHWTKPRLVFVNSMSDLFHADVPAGFVKDVWTTMAITPRHRYQVLTKRPQRMARILGDPAFDGNIEMRLHLAGCTDDVDWQDVEYPTGGARWLPNVWLGTSIELDLYTWRANHLRATPAAVWWLSLEPLLGPLPSLDLDGIHWVVVGGESGPGARPMHPDWVRDIRDRCAEAGVRFFFKQWGAWAPVEPVYDGDHDDVLIDGYDGSDLAAVTNTGSIDMHLHADGRVSGAQPRPELAPWWMAKVGKKAAGRVLDGRTHDDMPRAAAT